MIRCRHVALALVGVVLGAPTVVAGQGGAVTLRAGNDLFAVRGAGPPPDHDYTAGTRLSLDARGAPAWARAWLGRAPACGCVASGVGVAQEIYTPRHDSVSGPPPGDRPYAGVLVAEGYVRRVGPTRVRTLALRAGVVGPPAQAGAVQNGLHRLLHNREELGWSHQLATAPVFALSYDDTRVAEHPLGATLTRVALGWSASAGTLRTGAALGVRGWLGRSASLPWSPHAPYGGRVLSAYLVGGCRGDAVAHDATLDADPRPADARVRRLPFVAECELGAGGRGRAWGVEYRYVRRGREYRAQPAAHAYGAIALTLVR